MGLERDGMFDKLSCYSVHYFTVVHRGKKGRMRVIAGSDCCRRHITDRVQLHVIDTKQRLRIDSATHLPFLSISLLVFVLAAGGRPFNL